MNNLWNYFKIAYSNISRRQLRSWLTLIGIIIGIATVVSLNALGEGLEFAIESQFSDLGSNVITITASGGFGPPGTGVITPLSDKEFNAISSVSGIETVAGRILEFGKLVFNDKAIFGYSASLSNDKDQRELLEKLLNMEIEVGRFLTSSDDRKVILGNNFYTDSVGLGKIIKPGDKIMIDDVSFEVVGILAKKGNFQFDNTVFMNENTLRDLTNQEDDIYDIIVAEFDSNDDVDKIKAAIEKKLRKVRNVDVGDEDFSVQTPQSLLENVSSILLSIQIFVFIIASISVVVGGVGIMNTMYTAVLERIREVGIMKSIGATNSVIFTLFFIESGIIGAVGGIIGAALGSLMAIGLAFAGQAVLGADLIVAHITPSLLLYAIIGSFLIGSFFGTLPAIQAAKMKPVDALSHIK